MKWKHKNWLTTFLDNPHCRCQIRNENPTPCFSNLSLSLQTTFIFDFFSSRSEDFVVHFIFPCVVVVVCCSRKGNQKKGCNLHKHKHEFTFVISKLENSHRKFSYLGVKCHYCESNIGEVFNTPPFDVSSIKSNFLISDISNKTENDKCVSVYIRLVTTGAWWWWKKGGRNRKAAKRSKIFWIPCNRYFPHRLFTPEGPSFIFSFVIFYS